MSHHIIAGIVIAPFADFSLDPIAISDGGSPEDVKDGHVDASCFGVWRFWGTADALHFEVKFAT